MNETATNDPLLTVGQLATAARIDLTRAQIWHEPICAALVKFGIDTPARIAAFLAQASYETLGFNRLVENLYYTSAQRIVDVWPKRFASAGEAQSYVRAPEKLANFVYAYRNGNGGPETGDGWRYRGRGLFQLTGRANYQACAIGLGVPGILTTPEVVEEPWGAAASAAWYWNDAELNEYADTGAIDKISNLINTGSVARRAHGQSDRAVAFNHATQVLA